MVKITPTPTPTPTPTGHDQYDVWLVNDSQNFQWITGDLHKDLPALTPIRLHVGNSSFGQVHIDQRHGHWLQKLQTNTPILVWEELQKTAAVYLSSGDNRLKLSFRMNPQALMILDYRERAPQPYFSVVTIYSHPRQVDGKYIGRYHPKKP